MHRHELVVGLWYKTTRTLLYCYHRHVQQRSWQLKFLAARKFVLP